MTLDGCIQTSYTQNRELSWLKFNERVLNEAMDETVPLLEKLKFIAIFNSNLDEFFMVRVGKLFDLYYASPKTTDKKTGWTPMEQLEKIYKAVVPLNIKKDQLYDAVNQRLAQNGLCHLQWEQLTEKQKKYAKQYFKKNIQPILSPQIINSYHPFPHLENKKIYVVASLSIEERAEYAIIPIHASLPNALFFPKEGENVTYILIEDIILELAEEALVGYKITEKLKVKVTRNTDIRFEDDDLDDIEDFRNKVKEKLKKRKRLSPVRLEISQSISVDLRNFLLTKLELSKNAVYQVNSDMNLGYVFELSSKLSKVQKRILEYPDFESYIPNDINPTNHMLEQIRNKDILLAYPFESMSPFLKFIKDAAYDNNVISIKITIYRLSSSSKLVDYLCAAAENGKEVSILIELRARFDEQNNIDWSERLEQAGCNIIYGFDNFKVHSKICLVTRKEKNDIKYYTQIGTGNYNEKTAKQYTDLSLLTYDQEIGQDANAFFKNMGIANLNGEYASLLVAPNGFKNKILEYIKTEGEKGAEGYIFIKINALTDIDIIDALKDASCKGVKIEMIIRGVSCMIPNIKNETDNIMIKSIVGRFLEHSRIYKFGKDEQSVMFIGSADFMTRNMDRRVEVATPIKSCIIKNKVDKLIEICLLDNMKSRTMTSKSDYIKDATNKHPINSQELLLDKYLNEFNIVSPKANFPEKVWLKLTDLIKRKHYIKEGVTSSGPNYHTYLSRDIES